MSKKNTRKCRFCGDPIPTDKLERAKVCGEECRKRLHAIKIRLSRHLNISVANLTEEQINEEISRVNSRKCVVCNKPLGTRRVSTKYCSKECRRKAKRKVK